MPAEIFVSFQMPKIFPQIPALSCRPLPCPTTLTCPTLPHKTPPYIILSMHLKHTWTLWRMKDCIHNPSVLESAAPLWHLWIASPGCSRTCTRIWRHSWYCGAEPPYRPRLSCTFPKIITIDRGVFRVWIKNPKIWDKFGSGWVGTRINLKKWQKKKEKEKEKNICVLNNVHAPLVSHCLCNPLLMCGRLRPISSCYIKLSLAKISAHDLLDNRSKLPVELSAFSWKLDPYRASLKVACTDHVMWLTSL